MSFGAGEWCDGKVTLFALRDVARAALPRDVAFPVVVLNPTVILEIIID